MTTASNTLRALIVYAAVLPLALLVGYFAGGFSGSTRDVVHLGPVVVLLLVLSAPLLMKWHYPFLFLAWNMNAVVFFLPGSPEVWLVATAFSLVASIVQRALVREARFIHVPSLILPLIMLAVVLLITARVTGGLGLRVFGSETFGAKRYLLMFAGMAGFLAMTARQIPPDKATAYVGLFFLGGLSNTLSSLIAYGPTQFYWLALTFPVSTNDVGPLASMLDLRAGQGQEVTRAFGSSIACLGVFFYLLARFGIRGILTLRKIHRLIFLLGAVAIASVGGYRSFIILMAFTFLCLFYFEGLLRSKYFIVLVGLFLVSGGLLVGFANKLPLSIQRTLSILPIEIDPIARLSAESTTEWRLQMWKVLLPEVPKHLWLGKGLGMQELEMERSVDLARNYDRFSYEAAVVAGDYHNGPLSVIIPFGIFGALAFLWFLLAAGRALYFNFRYGDPALRNINALLLSLFFARCLLFFFIFGGLYSDLAQFAGLAGLSVALNGGIRKPLRVPRLARPIPIRVRPSLRSAAAGVRG